MRITHFATISALTVASFVPGASPAIARDTSANSICRFKKTTLFAVRSWNDAANWDCGVVPGPGDSATIDNFGDLNYFPDVIMPTDVTVSEFTFQDGRIEGVGRSLTVSKAFTWTGGVLFYTSLTSAAAGTLTIPANAAAQIGAPPSTPSTSAEAPGLGIGQLVNGGAISFLGSPKFVTFPLDFQKITNNGMVNVTGGGGFSGQWLNNGVLNVSLPATATVSLGTIGKAGAEAADYAQFGNYGVINLNSGIAQLAENHSINRGLRPARHVQFGGEFRMNGGTLDIGGLPNNTSGGLFDLRGGALIGAGSILGDLINKSVITQTGALHVLGDYEQAGTGRLALDVRGLHDFEQLSIAYTALLSGTLAVDVAPAASLGISDSLKLVRLDGPTDQYTITDQFSSTALSAGYIVSYTPQFVLLCKDAGSLSCPAPQTDAPGSTVFLPLIVR